MKRYRNRIIILAADKCHKPVIMYRDNYNNKMRELLDVKDTYRTSRKDPTSKLFKTNNNIMLSLYKNNHINIRTKNKLTCNEADAPRLYGLPKIHKTGELLRPISSSVDLLLARHIGTL